jgi:hypothetical protein
MKSLTLLALCIGIVSAASPALAMGPAAGTRGDDSGSTAPPAKADPSLPVKSESISGPTNPPPPIAPGEQRTTPCTTTAKPGEGQC